VIPEKADVDVRLSRQLTQAVQRQGQLVWLASRPPDEEPSQSLASFQDAVCAPLKAAGSTFGALHVYKANRNFTFRQVRFIEVLAAFLAKSLHVLRGRRTLVAENVRLRGKTKAPQETMIGTSPALEQVRQQIERLAPLDCTVLVTGESGVGKEPVALALHRNSQRRDGPMVIVNCGAIAPSLLEAELFGHAKGAFTGAVADRPGFFQQADEGTLFLDEIGDMPLECQVKLLRVIEGDPVRPVGSTEGVRVDVRIIAATHRDLEKMVREGKFRHDLYYRLGVPIAVPPLRERPDDVAALAEHFLAQFSADYRRELRLTPAAQARLKTYPWPGNVRQLRAVLEVAAAMSDGPAIDASDLRLNGPATPGNDDELNLERLEMRTIREALRRHGGISAAADALGIHRDTLSAKMKKYGIPKSGD
jgi:Nif-specific regulatory protein